MCLLWVTTIISCKVSACMTNVAMRGACQSHGFRDSSNNDVFWWVGNEKGPLTCSKCKVWAYVKWRGKGELLGIINQINVNHNSMCMKDQTPAQHHGNPELLLLHCGLDFWWINPFKAKGRQLLINKSNYMFCLIKNCSNVNRIIPCFKFID